MTQRAAFFDLDRTVIAGSSGVVLSRALRESGVVDGAKLPGEDALYRVYASMGENLPSMVLARQGVVALRGVARHRVIGAAHSVIDDLLNLVLPGAREAIDQHRRDGLRVVLATTTPHDVVAAFARRIGFDDVIATRFQVDEHDCYTGDLVGPFTWSAGKLSAVRTWCDTHEVSLPHSYAYSDSYYDTPLLEAVGHPHAVNPDFRLSSLAAKRQWPTVTFNDVDPPTPPTYHDIQRAGLALLRPELFPFVRFDMQGLDNIPSDGPVILVVEHHSHFDAVAVAQVLARVNRTARFIGPQEIFAVPLVGRLAALLGGIGSPDVPNAESVEAAAQSLEGGELVVVWCRPSGHTGDSGDGSAIAAQLSTVTQAPMLRITVTGSQEVWPRGQLLPSWSAGNPPHDVNVTIG